MKQQLEVWLQIMTKGATTAPRQRARDPQTVRVHLQGIAPIIQAWADAGHQSLAEITPEQVRQALPEKGARRNLAEHGLRSLFKALKGRKLVFADPTRGMKASPVATNVPLSLDTAAIRGELNSPDPVIALAVALVAFHALTRKRVRALHLTDIVDGHLILGDRAIPLAAPVRTRLAAWLNHRNRTWPGTANPHLLINRRTAPRLVPVGAQFPWLHTTLRPQALREDRILSEIHATGGDIRRICDLFGLSVEGATRYLMTVEHPDLTTPGTWVPRT
jgi:site-specific recombinase XerC